MSMVPNESYQNKISDETFANLKKIYAESGRLLEMCRQNNIDIVMFVGANSATRSSDMFVLTRMQVMLRCLQERCTGPFMLDRILKMQKILDQLLVGRPVYVHDMIATHYRAPELLNEEPAETERLIRSLMGPTPEELDMMLDKHLASKKPPEEPPVTASV